MSPGDKREGARQLTFILMGCSSCLLSLSRRRHPPNLIMTGHEVAEKPASGNEVLVSLQELAAPRIRLRKPAV